MNSEKFCLRWNDFETNISVAFKELREEKDFFDVTLACDDNQIQAHKVILSACSPFFRNVLRRNPHQHPLLYIKGVKYQDLLSVLNFMYNGEVNIAQEELNTFLAVAEDLRVKGLTQNNSATTPRKNVQNQESTGQVNRQREPPEREPPPPLPKRPRPAPPSQTVNNYQQNRYDEDIQEVVPVKSEPREPQPIATNIESHTDYRHQEMVHDHQAIEGTGHNAVALDQGYVEDEGYNYDEYDDSYNSAMMNSNLGAVSADGNKDLEVLINSKMTKVPGDTSNVWQCVDCNYNSKLKHNVFEHIESKHVQHEGYFCYLCNTSCPSQSAFRMHNKRKHTQPTQFSCP